MAIEEMIKIAPHIFIYSPPNPDPGQLVIVCTWMGAADKHIAKYVALYQEVAPASKILLLKSELGTMLRPHKEQQASSEPAGLVVRQLLDECAQAFHVKPHILLHMFSSGGINSATHLLVDLQRRLGRPTPLIGLICDSAPARASYWRPYRACMHAFPSRFPVDVLTSLAVHILLIFQFLCTFVFRYDHDEDLWRKAVLDDKLVGSNRICYIASKSDDITDWRDVVAHADTARSKEWHVREIIHDNARHCNHLSKNQKSYFDAITNMWKD